MMIWKWNKTQTTQGDGPITVRIRKSLLLAVTCLLFFLKDSEAAIISCDIARLRTSELLGVILVPDSQKLDLAAKGTAAALATTGIERGYKKMLIVGHSDHTGPLVTIQKTSEQRASQIAAIIALKLPQTGEMNVMPCGDQIPLIPQTGQEQVQNRRVEVRGER